MSWLINNLDCNGCDFFEEEVMYRRSEGVPECPECGSDRQMSFRGLRYAVHGESYGSFGAVDFGILGKAETKEQYDQCINVIKQRFPNHQVNIEHDTNAQRTARSEERQHNTYLERKARGYDSQTMKERRAEGRALESEKSNGGAKSVTGSTQ
tara:strand:+ start:4011 stop:4469 length:459 start_codon:yes stop_codon:yes gene_type:complete